MECPHCGHGNPDDANFCSNCGKGQESVCPSCGANVDADANFCNKCGTSLAPSPTVGEASELLAAPSAERRQLTVVFCDIVGSTALSGQLDPESLRDLIRAYQTAAEKVILRYEGHIAQYLGDGLLVYFGYPVAHEDDVHRAVRASLGILGSVALLAPEIKERYGVDLAVRIGAHTGHVIVGEMGGDKVHEALAVGDTPNIAARVQDAAEPGSLVISGDSHRIVERLFDCTSLGSQPLRGVATPVELHQVHHESAARTRFAVAATAGLTPLVGRDHEVAVLRERWNEAKGGAGHVVSLRGEAGIGKSRLLWALKEHVALDADAWFTECQCSAHHRNSALYPIIDMFETTVLGFTRDDSTREKRDKLTGLLAQYGFDSAEALPLFGELFSIPPGEDAPPVNLTPAQKKVKVNEGFTRMLSIRASEQPVLFVVEDLHWADPSTLDLLAMLMDQVPSLPLLMVVTSRPEFEPRWGQRSYITPLSLTRLGAEHTADMLARIAGDKALPPEVVEQVVTKTDGVPLFVEELVKTVIDSDMVEERDGKYELTRPLPALGIPSTLHASLLARLDRLAGVRDVLQLAATVGREFSYELLHAVSPLDEATLRNHLAELVSTEFLYPRGAPPTATYTFKHALIQDAAYGSLLRSTQQQYHQQIAVALERGASASGGPAPELLAHHFTQGGRPQEAVVYWHRAGVRATERAATVEAISHFTKARELLATLPVSAVNRDQELETLTELGPSLTASVGYGAPEVMEVYTRALEVSRQLGEDSIAYSRALSGLWIYYMARGPHETAWEIARQLLTTAEGLGDPRLQVTARGNLADMCLHAGDFVGAAEHGRAGIALDHDHPRGPDDDDAGIMCRVWVSWSLHALGYADQAQAIADEALALGVTDSSALVRTEAWLYATAYQVRIRDYDTCRVHCAELGAIAVELDFRVFQALGKIYLGWVRASQGDEDGVDAIRGGIAEWRATGSSTAAPAFLAMLAEGCIATGRTTEALDATAEAIAMSEETGAKHSTAELYRLRGDALLQRHGTGGGPHAAEAEESYRRSIALAQEQRAKTWELRATMSLARLWNSLGKTTDARALFDDVYGWFTEGFDTPDLIDARALRETLT